MPNVFIPRAKFACPRSYWRGFSVDLSGYNVFLSGQNIIWVKLTDPNEVWTTVISPKFFPWSSNRYTLDYVISDFYLQLLPNPTHLPQPYTLQTIYHPTNLAPYLWFQFAGIPFGVYHWLELPPAPADYWKPPWLP